MPKNLHMSKIFSNFAVSNKKGTLFDILQIIRYYKLKKFTNMKATLNEKEFAFFANHKEEILAALNSAQINARQYKYKALENLYSDMWMELYDILKNNNN